jgi:hypothetical protein
MNCIGEKKHEAYSGLFILLRHRLKLRQFLRLIKLALDRFRAKRRRRLAVSYLLPEGQAGGVEAPGLTVYNPDNRVDVGDASTPPNARRNPAGPTTGG